MRVPDVSFLLHLLCAMVLLVDNLAALSTSAQTLTGNEQFATDRRLRVHAPRAHHKIIGDEERTVRREIVNLLRGPNPQQSWLSTLMNINDELSHILQFAIPAQTLHSSDIIQNSHLLALLEKYFNEVDRKQKHEIQRFFAEVYPQSDTYTDIATYMASYFKISLPEELFVSNRLGFWLDGLNLYGFSNKEVELIFRAAGYQESTVNNILDFYDFIKTTTSIEEALSVFINYMNHRSLHTQSLVILDVRAANVVISREQIMQSKQSPDFVGPNSIPHDWKYLLTQWINHFYTQDRVHLILQHSDLKRENLQQILGYYDQIKSTLQKTPDFQLSINNARHNTEGIEEAEKEYTQSIVDQISLLDDPKLIEDKWIKLFNHWIFLNFSRDQIKSHLQLAMQSEEDVSSVMARYEKLVQ
ncbi:hypothetical protein Plhal703r1_c03g0016141 [Plasmopara halstedii]